MTTYGVTSAGFTAKTLPIIETEIDDRLIAIISPYVNTDPRDIIGQIKEVYAALHNDIWELGSALYSSRGVLATGVSLDNEAVGVGKKRLEALPVKILDYELTVDGSVVLSAGYTFSKNGEETIKFELDDDLNYTYVGPGNETIAVDLTATANGAQTIGQDTINIIDSPVSGLVSASNSSTASVTSGRDQESDAELRARMQNDPFISRESTEYGIRSAILDLNDDTTIDIETIVNVIVIENPLGVADADGRPAHSTEVLAYYIGAADPATDTEIAETIATVHSMGSELVSTTSANYTATVTMQGGNTFPVIFSRPDSIPIYAKIKVAGVASAVLTTAQKTALKSDIAIWGNALGMAQDVVVFGRDSLTGVLNDFADTTVTDYEISISTTSPAAAPVPGTTDANLSIDYTEVSTWSTANIDILDFLKWLNIINTTYKRSAGNNSNSYQGNGGIYTLKCGR